MKQDIWKNISSNLIKTVSNKTAKNDTKYDDNDDNNNENNINASNNNNNIAMQLQKNHQHETLSFQQMIYQLASSSSTSGSRNCNGDAITTAAATTSSKESNQDVTLPFYFICLLHLANEHVSYLLSKYLLALPCYNLYIFLHFFTLLN